MAPDSIRTIVSEVSNIVKNDNICNLVQWRKLNPRAARTDNYGLLCRIAQKVIWPWLRFVTCPRLRFKDIG